MGDNVSPALAWEGVPAEAESLLLLMFDLDAGFESGASTELGFAHWIVYNIPPDTDGFAEDMPAGELPDGGGLQGSNDFAPYDEPGNLFPGGGAIKIVGYDGPCPGEEHRYVFRLHALDTMLPLESGATMAELLAAMAGHILNGHDIVGFYTPP